MPDYGLSGEWSTYLEDRGVTPEIARQRGYRAVMKGKPIDGQFASAYGFPPKTSGLLIPLHPLNGGDEVYQLRLDVPQISKGKERKFLTPYGQSPVLVTAPATKEKLSLPGQVIVVAEGVTRVDASARYVIPAIGILGAYGWRGGKPPIALPDWESVAVKGNRFILAFDGDVQTNGNVRDAAQRLSAFLSGRGADHVLILNLPGTQGLDDWLATSDFADSSEAMTAILKLCQEKVDLVTAPMKAGATFSVEDAGPWSCTPAADIRRLLEYAPTKLCVVREHEGPWKLLVEAKGGRWTTDEGVVGTLHMDSALAWLAKVTKGVMSLTLESSHAKTCQRWAITSAKPQGLRDALAMLSSVVPHLQGRDLLPDELTICDAQDIDADLTTMGTPDGVLDLNTGEMLDVPTARGRYVTRSIPDTYNPDATHPWIDDLVAHLGPVDGKYILDAMGFGLRGIPARRWYALVGEKGGGKTTIQEAVLAAFGRISHNGYGMFLAVTALMTTRWGKAPNTHDAGLFGVQSARLAFTGEPPAGGRFNGELMKDLTGGASMRLRDLGEKAGGELPVRATILCAMNPSRLESLRLDESAFADRTRLLQIPRLPIPEDQLLPSHMVDMTTTPAVRQALVALLVRHCVNNSIHPPADTPSVQEFGASRRAESIGVVGNWFEDHLRVTNNPGDYVKLDKMLARLAAEVEPWNEDGRIEGRSRTEIIALAREVVQGLPSTKRMRDGSEWRGVRLLTSPDEEVGQPLIPADQGTCVDCGQVARIGNLCDDCRAKRQNNLTGTPTGGDAPGTPPGQGPLAAGLQGHLDEIAAMQEELKEFPARVAFLEMQAKAFRSLRSAAPDRILTASDLALLGGVADVVDIIEQLVLTHPLRHSVRWETVDWHLFLTGWIADFKKSLEPSRAGLLDQGKAMLQHVIHQRPLLSDEGSTA